MRGLGSRREDVRFVGNLVFVGGLVKRWKGVFSEILSEKNENQ